MPARGAKNAALAASSEAAGRAGAERDRKAAHGALTAFKGKIAEIRAFAQFQSRMLDMADSECGSDDRQAGLLSGQQCGACVGPWHVVATEYQAERLAQQSIHELGYRTLLPLIRRRTEPTKARPARTILTPVFPGYVLAAWDAGAPWTRVRRAKGVASVLTGVGIESPAILPDAFIAALVSRMDGDNVVQDLSVPDLLPALPVMTAVMIRSGPLAGQRGIVEWSTEERVALLLHVLGGYRRAQMRRDHVEPEQ